ncbi:MAG: hypothetical protein GEV28_37725, partial [Actinophytocola sp.]|nr:hypothetical protein [Actinophytocola sp.]
MIPSSDVPRAPVAATVVVLSALLVGAGALAGSSVLTSEPPRMVLAVALVLAGWWVARLAHGPAGVALGRPVLAGIGTSFGVLGVYLGGLALLITTESSSPVVVVLLVYGVPALALLAVAATGMRAWPAGAGAVLPMVAVLLLTAGGVGAGAVSVTMLAVGVVLAVVVVRSPAASVRGDLASAAAATATSFAFGAGTSPFGSLGATQVPGVGAGASGALPAGALAAVVAGALLVASVLMVVAVLRRDVAGGLLVGTVFAMPPLTLASVLRPAQGWPAEILVAVTAVPVLTALVAMLAIRVPAARRALAAVPVAMRPAREADADPDEPGASAVATSGALVVASLAVVVAGAAVVFIATAMPLFGWGAGAEAAVALVVLVVAGALGSWLPGAPGAAAAVVAL